MNLTAYTTVKSYVSKKTHDKFGENSLWFISNEQIRMVLGVEQLFKGCRLFVNNWESGGALNACGTRFTWDNN